MSFKAMLEVAKTQGSVASLADAFAIELDTSRLSTSTEIISEKACKFYVEHATAEETVALLNICIDQTDMDFDATILESACGSCAVIIFNDDDAQTEQASLETAGILDTSKNKVLDEEEYEDDPAIVEEDDDVDPDEDDEDDEDVEDEDRLKILGSDENFRLAQRLHQMACGNNKHNFAKFLTQLDTFLMGEREKTGYDPSRTPDTASDESIAELLASSFYELEESRKKKKGKGGFKEGRGGFLSAYMRIIGKNGENLADAWDGLDIELLIKLLSEAGDKLINVVQEERYKRGLDEKPEAMNEPEDEGVVEAARKYYILVSFDGHKWIGPEFGDYDKEVVKSELEDYVDGGEYKRKNLKILTIAGTKTTDAQVAIDALNKAGKEHASASPKVTINK